MFPLPPMTDGHMENLGHWLDITVLIVLMVTPRKLADLWCVSL